MSKKRQVFRWLDEQCCSPAIADNIKNYINNLQEENEKLKNKIKK